MEKKTESGELDLSVSKLMSGCSAGRGKNRLKNNELRSDASISSSLGSLLNSSVSLEPTPPLLPTRSSISSLLSLSHLRLWENPITASAISAAAAMTHLMDINNSAFSSAFGGKSSEDHRPGSRNMCIICGRVARDENELERHMLTHSMEKTYQCVKYGLSANRMQGLLRTSKKRKSNVSESYSEEPLDVTMPDMKKKRMDSSWNSRAFDCTSPEDYKTKMNCETNTNKSMSAVINTTAFPCTSCHKTFATEVDLKAHLMRHLTQHPFVCLACGKGFKYEHSLNFHIKSYHNSSGNINNNNNSSSTINNMENETKHSDSQRLSDNEIKSENKIKVESENTSEADYEAETSLDEDSDEDNDNDNDNDSNHNKDLCFDYGAPANFAARSIQIKSEKILITLLEGIHPVTEQTYILYKCCLCGFAFPSLEPVILHMQSSHLNTNKEFTCDKCGANFKWRSELSLHEQLHKAMDQNDKSGQLSVPSFMQPNLVLMSTDFGPNLSPSHTNNNNNNSISNNNCLSEGTTLCDEKLSQNKPHKSIKATKQKSEPHHSSDIILKTEDLQSQVSLSQKFPAAIIRGDIEETAPGQFKCRFCDKTFDRIFSVHRHERVHTGFKPCICKTCGRGFSEKRNLRHHIIRFHSDGSGRELLKRNRKDKTNGNSINKRKVATSLKKAALKILNNGNETTEKISSDDNNCDKKSIESKDSQICTNDESIKTSSTSVESSIECVNSTKVTQNNASTSSTRRRKGKPSKKIITTEEFSPVSPSFSTVENIENHDNDETQNTDKSKDETDANSGSEINPNDFLETKFRCHGAFFSSYNPRLGVVEKPVKRNEACRPLLGPDGKFLYPCTYCNKTFCSLSDLNRHMNFHEDVRPFKCEFCNYQSRTHSQLKVHMLRHAGIKQYLCQVCNYNGVTQSDLNRHCKTRSHALRSANICPLCSLGFSTRTLLDDHVIKFHEASESSSNSSDKSTKTSNQLSKATPERNNNDYSFSSKSFSMKEILN